MNIQLDDFQPTFTQFIEHLEIEGAEEREWIMMGIVNIASILEYHHWTIIDDKGWIGAIRVTHW
jgi:hypothetical protein